MVVDAYWHDKPIPTPDASYITSIQNALKTLGFLPDNFTATGEMDDATRAAIQQLQGGESGLGSNGDLT
ncbi:MAG: peptidoglycan-binding protein [Alphaproteobacteria bacterium]|nr:peptidoglycan-binding protein [Alphaproteobacteria bacterium]